LLWYFGVCVGFNNLAMEIVRRMEAQAQLAEAQKASEAAAGAKQAPGGKRTPTGAGVNAGQHSHPAHSKEKEKCTVS